MLGLDTYGSGSESENESEKQQSTKPQPSPGLTREASKSSIILPPPSYNSTTIPKASLPPPKTKRAPKKITIGLPALPKDDEEKDDMELDRPAAKRQKTGAGASSLLSMLPAPKQKAPSTGQSERVLGGGKGPGLIFHAKPSPAPATSSAMTEEEDQENEDDGEGAAEPTSRPASLTTAKDVSSLPFLPPSLVKGKANISLEDKPKLPAKPPLRTVSAAPAIESSSTGNSTSTTSSSSTPNYSFTIPTLSSAPAIPTFEPPEPTPQDPYPGYYQLPSGSWASYDPQYYERFREKWQAEYDAYVRKLEKGAIKGFEGYEEGASEVDATKEMEKAKLEVREREEKKALTKGATGPAAQPNMKLNPSKLSGIARSRHQLSTLLRDAYENREALEEKIAEGRRNRKEAGNKYGF